MIESSESQNLVCENDILIVDVVSDWEELTYVDRSDSIKEYLKEERISGTFLKLKMKKMPALKMMKMPELKMMKMPELKMMKLSELKIMMLWELMIMKLPELKIAKLLQKMKIAKLLPEQSCG